MQVKNWTERKKKQLKNDCSALEKCLGRFRADKVTEAELEHIRQMKANLEHSSEEILRS